MKIMVTLGYSHELKVAWKQKTDLVLKAVTYQRQEKGRSAWQLLEQLHCVQNGLRSSLYILSPGPSGRAV
jgi:hypothetical protein